MTETVFLDAALLADGWARDVVLTMANGRIVAVQTGAVPSGAMHRHGIGLPGLPNLHSHAFQHAMAGRAERRGQTADSFWSWRELMYRSLDLMTPEDVQAITAYAFMEMIEGGFTQVAEFHYLHRTPAGEPYDDPAEMAVRVVEAAHQTGIGLTLLPVFYAHGSFADAAPTHGQRRFLADLDFYARLLEGSRAAVAGLPGARLGVAPHSLRAAAPDEIAAVAAMAPDGPIHIHVAEQIREVEDCLAWSGARPVEWMLDNVALDACWCFIHATHMVPREIIRLAASGVCAGLCPLTEASLGDGVFPGPAWQDAGGRWGIGTDSNVMIGANAELRQLEYAQRLAARQRNVMTTAGTSTGRALFDAARRGGWQALGDAASGVGLAVGAPADLVVLAPDPSGEGQTDEAIDRWIFARADRGIEAVWCAGVRLVEGGQHIRRPALAHAYKAAIRRLYAR